MHFLQKETKVGHPVLQKFLSESKHALGIMGTESYQVAFPGHFCRKLRTSVSPASRHGIGLGEPSMG